MYARQHLMIRLLIASILLFVFGFGFKVDVDMTTEFGSILLFLAPFVWFGGAILPDSDSENCGSTIFYTPFFPIAFLLHFLEGPLAGLLNEKKGHRGVLHTIKGILASSLITVIVFWILGVWIFKTFMAFTSFIFLFLILFISQFLHLLEDGMGSEIF